MTKTAVSYKVWTKDEILASFDKYDRRSFLRVVKVIYDRQTADEREVKDTKHSNGMGFNGTDARFMMDIYEKACRYGGFTEGQFAAAKKCMRKYAGQLALVKNEMERARWEEARAAEAKAEDEAFRSAYPEKAAEVDREIAAEAAKEPDMCFYCGSDCYGTFCSPSCEEDYHKTKCLVCDEAAGGSKFCSTECAAEYAADNYEGPDAEDVALSRAYASAF